MTRTRLPGWVAALLGGVALVLVWWIFALTVFTPAEGTTFTPVPTPVAVFQWLFVQGNIAGTWSVFAPTLAAAGIGYLWGNGIALLLATIVLLFPKAETVITQIAGLWSVTVVKLLSCRQTAPGFRRVDGRGL